MTSEVHSPYVDSGATAFDIGDGDLTAAIVTVNPVDTSIVGTYTVTYDVTDSQGNAAAQVSRTVDVVDTSAPVITLTGANPQTIEVGDPYVELGATASDNYDGTLTGSIAIVGSAVDTGTVGTYLVTYDVTDANGNAAATAVRTVDVVDTVAPVLTLLGPAQMSLTLGDTFTDPGAEAVDAVDGVLPVTVDASGLDLSAGGTYVVVYTAVDFSGNPATAMRQVTVVVPNSPPVATDDTYQVNEVGQIGMPAPGVLSNDADADGDPLTVALVTDTSYGDLVLNASGSFTYTHDGLGGVEDSFVYQVSDGRGGLDTASVRIVVPVLNHVPVADDHIVVIDEDHVARIPVAVGADEDGDELVIKILSAPEVGEFTIRGESIVFTPPADWFGEVSVDYSLTDSFGSTAVGSVVVIVEAVNDAPVGGADSIVLSNYLVTVLEVLSNDFDIEGDTLTIVGYTNAEHGRVEYVDGELRYTPDAAWVGVDQFTYTVSDGRGGRATVEVDVETPASALIAAIGMAGTVGTGLLQVDVPEPQALTRLALNSPQAVRLWKDVFFQSVSAMQIPLILLLIGGFWALVGGTPWATGLLAARRYWAVVWVGPEEKLDVYEEPSEESASLFKLQPNARGLVSTGRPVKDPKTGTTWIPIEAEAGRGWVNRAHLTEDIDEIEFAGDRRPQKLVDRMAKTRWRRLRRGLLGTRGMFVALNGQAVNVPSDQINEILTNDHDGEAPSLLDLFLESWRSPVYELAIDATLERSHLIPAQCKNYHYLSVRSPGSPGWLIFFEYRHGRARIAGLGAEA